jgi:hypothetical protein
MSGKMLASAKYHPTFPEARALERLCRRGPISLCRESTSDCNSSSGIITRITRIISITRADVAIVRELRVRGDIERDIRIVHDLAVFALWLARYRVYDTDGPIGILASPGQSKGQLQGRGTTASLLIE